MGTVCSLWLGLTWGTKTDHQGECSLAPGSGNGHWALGPCNIEGPIQNAPLFMFSQVATCHSTSMSHEEAKIGNLFKHLALSIEPLIMPLFVAVAVMPSSARVPQRYRI